MTIREISAMAAFVQVPVRSAPVTSVGQEATLWWQVVKQQGNAASHADLRCRAANRSSAGIPKLEADVTASPGTLKNVTILEALSSGRQYFQQGQYVWQTFSMRSRSRRRSADGSSRSPHGMVMCHVLDARSPWTCQQRSSSVKRLAASSNKAPITDGNCDGGVDGRGMVDEEMEEKDERRDELLQVRGVSYFPAGVKEPLLDKVSLSLPKNSLGLIYGKSGSGKTTLLQILGGLYVPTSGIISFHDENEVAAGGRGAAGDGVRQRRREEAMGQRSRGGTRGRKRGCTRTELTARTGLVFQFPERYFLSDTVLEELTFGWPRGVEDLEFRKDLAMRLQIAAMAVGITGISLDTSPRSLSDGYKRRLALAIQLVRLPDVLLLDEPLAGLDWKARGDLVRLLRQLKKDRTIIVVSHDLRELAPLVDRAWEMEIGGRLKEVQTWSAEASMALSPASEAMKART
ncbi:hypothetical protein CBR_g57502 [Chara braunii]|uniref:ABC transporter domain-containing protein n=1 Tax=Chara braunii TaxID=69332 RepID=A0A388ME57_CHABU|nr:hypothetical protein CBR_g57502 [Chara braunii]|eukprot:GBG92846.1 hypothetical protein CBR_g57502 [Chara braunii]